MKDYVQAEKEAKERQPRGPVEPIGTVCSSDKLDEVLTKGDLKVSYKVPECEAVKYVSDKTTGMELPPVDQVVRSKSNITYSVSMSNFL